ncbi:MAG: DUF3343 domain-containing protein [Ruminococcaceae bacterium]|nr:DUF3343 domain-containing protein [Oscillospiraceae bacterium]
MKYIINLGSVTYAMKAKEILFSHGIKAYIEKNHRQGAFGCGYGVSVKDKKEETLKILREHGIKVYSVTEL